MLRVPLDIKNIRDISVSSCADQSFDPTKLSAIVDQQRRTIRKLNARVAKLEGALRKEIKESRGSKTSINGMPSDVQFTVLREEIQRSNMLEDAVSKIYNKSTELLRSISESGRQSSKRELPTLPSVKSLPSINILTEDDEDESSSFQKIERTMTNFDEIFRLSQQKRAEQGRLLQERKIMKSQIDKNKTSKKDFQFEIEQLKQFRELYELQRKNCQKLKGLLEKSEYQRNSMLTKIHRKANKEKDIYRSNDEWVTLSKTQSCRIEDLEKEKNKILEEGLKESEKWRKMYAEMYRKLKMTQKQKVEH